MTEPVRILVLDPHDTDANVCVEALERRGWSVDRARRYAEALALVKESSYDVVIVDFMLPDVLGTEAWARLKAQCPQMACILTTASQSLWDSVDVYQEDILDFLVKPLKMDAVCNLITHFTRHRRIASLRQQQEHELRNLSVWLSSLLRTSTRHEILDWAITHLEVILPPNWTAALFSPEGQLSWISRSTRYQPPTGAWTAEQSDLLEGVAKDAIHSNKVIVQQPCGSELTNLDQVGLGALVAVPLGVQTRTHGALVFVNDCHEEQDAFQSETDLAIIFGKTMALALDWAHLVNESRNVPLSIDSPTEQVEA